MHVYVCMYACMYGINDITYLIEICMYCTVRRAAGGAEWNWSPGIIGHSAFSETQVRSYIVLH